MINACSLVVLPLKKHKQTSLSKKQKIQKSLQKIVKKSKIVSGRVDFTFAAFAGFADRLQGSRL